MTSTELAHALGVPLDTPGCWDKKAIVCNHKRPCTCHRKQHVCLWPMPDSGEPGAELWTYWLFRALGWPSILRSDIGYYWVRTHECEFGPYSTLTTTLYAAYKDTKS